MKPDLYTKAMLTFITLTLAWIALRDLSIVSAAQGDTVQKVMVVDWAREMRPLNVTVADWSRQTRPLHAVLVDEAGFPIGSADGVRVMVMNRATQPVPAGIVTVQRGRDAGGKPMMPWEALQVEVGRSPNTRTPGE